jgi:hypothetical protein
MRRLKTVKDELYNNAQVAVSLGRLRARSNPALVAHLFIAPFFKPFSWIAKE